MTLTLVAGSLLVICLGFLLLGLVRGRPAKTATSRAEERGAAGSAIVEARELHRVLAGEEPLPARDNVVAEIEVPENRRELG